MTQHRTLSYVQQIPMMYKEAEPFANGLARVRTGAIDWQSVRNSLTAEDMTAIRWGVVNTAGSEVIPPVYLEMGTVSGGVTWAIREDNTHVLVDTSANEIFIFPQGLEVSWLVASARRPYASPVAFSPELSSQRVGYLRSREQIPMVNTTGPHVVTMRTEGNRLLFGLLDYNGVELIAPAHPSLGYYSAAYNRINISQNSRTVIMDIDENVIAETTYSSMHPFIQGVAAVTASGLMGLVDLYGNEVVAPEYGFILPFSDGLALVQATDINRRFGYINTMGEVIIPAVYPRARSFSDGLAAVAQRVERPGTIGQPPEMLWGYINGAGEQVVGFQFDEALRFSDGMAAVAVLGDDGKLVWGFVNTMGELVHPRFAWVDDFHEGYAVVNEGGEVYIPTDDWQSLSPLRQMGCFVIGGRYLLIDRWGREVLDLSRYDAVGHLSEGMLAVNWGFRLSDGTGTRYIADEGLWGFIRIID
jgi:hypothetical protein